MKENDLFYLEKTYAKPFDIISFNYKNARCISKKCIYVFDTNILLLPYDTSSNTLLDIKNIFGKYIQNKRLLIPARVLREFIKNRGIKMGDVFLKLDQRRENLNKGQFIIDEYPLLLGNENYEKIKDNFKKIREMIADSQKLIDDLESEIRQWNWDDEVSKMYKSLINEGMIIETEKSEEELTEILRYKINHKIAPGFKDSGKIDDGIGDIVIWETIKEIGKKYDNDVIFVSHDAKNDWFYKQNKITLYPRFELFEEFRLATNNKSFAIIDFTTFLELSEAKEETIQESKTLLKENDWVICSDDKFRVGQRVNHKQFGIGRVTFIRRLGNGMTVINVLFDQHGLKRLLTKYAYLKVDINDIENDVIENDEEYLDPDSKEE